MPLCIRGGGSKDFFGATLQGELLDTRPLSGIVSYEPSELVVTVRAGTLVSELEAVLAERGQCLAFEPPRFSICSPAHATTCAGMVAAGLSGPARANAGSVRDFVLGLSLLNGKAELLRFGGTVMKNVAGYDVSRLMVGAWGSLGVITEVSIKVLPQAPAQATLSFPLDQAQALALLHRWGGQPLPLNASVWGPVGPTTEAPPRLLVRLRGAVAAVEAACLKMLGDAAGQRLVDGPLAFDWDTCRDQRLPFFTQPPSEDMGLWRLSVAQTAPVLDLPWPQLVEWHGGQRWLWAPCSARAALHAAAQQAGGHATLFVPPRLVPQPSGPISRTAPLSGPLERIHRQLKAEFDPANIFNRGRLWPDTVA